MNEHKSALDEVLEKIDAIQQEVNLVEESKRLIRDDQAVDPPGERPFSVVDENLFDQIKTNKPSLSEAVEERKEKSAIRRLLDEEEDENDESEEIKLPEVLEDCDTEDIEDFEKEEDRDEIYRDLKATVGKMAVKQFFLFLLSLVSVYLFAGTFASQLIGGNPDAIWVRVSFLLIDVVCVFLSFGIFTQGLKKMLRAKADTDTLLALLAICVIVLRVVTLAKQDLLLYSFALEPFLAIGLFFNVAAKKKIASNIKRNFKMIAVGEDKLTVSIPASCENNNALILETGEGGEVMYAHRTRLVSGFIEHSYSDFSLERKMEHFQFICFLLIVVATVAIAQLIGWREAFMFPATALAVSIPFFSRLYYGASIYNVGKRIRKKGGILTSVQSAKKLSDGDLLVISEEDFVGKNDVLLQGIRAMGEMQIDDLITNIAALFNQVGTPMKPLFMKMIDSNSVKLPRVDDIYCHEGMGFSCLIHSKMFLVGNKDLMAHFNIPFPKNLLSLELKTGHFPVYVSYHKSPAGMFLASYDPNEGTEESVKMAADDYLGFGVVSNNFLFNRHLMKQMYPDITAESFHLISSKTSNASRPMLERREKADDLLASVSGPKGLVAGLRGGSKLIWALKINVIIKILYILTSIALIFFIALAGYSENTAFQIMMFQLIWLIPVWIICSFCK